MRGEIIGSGAHSHDHTGDRTGGSYLGAGPHRMNCPPPDPPGFRGDFSFFRSWQRRANVWRR